MELFGLSLVFLLVLLYKPHNKIVPDDDKNKDKRDDIERWNDYLNYRGWFFRDLQALQIKNTWLLLLFVVSLLQQNVKWLEGYGSVF